jgi:hypothetical protein
MDPLLALLILSWIAIIVLYLGLAAVLREVRMLRREVAAASSMSWLEDAEQDEVVRLPPGVAPGRTVVLASDSSCPLCRLLVSALAAQRDAILAPVVVLGYEQPEEWRAFPTELTYVQDESAWQQIAHLSPPVLLVTDGAGVAEQIAMPSSEAEAIHLLQLWGLWSGVPPMAAVEQRVD